MQIKNTLHFHKNYIIILFSIILLYIIYSLNKYLIEFGELINYKFTIILTIILFQPNYKDSLNTLESKITQEWNLSAVHIFILSCAYLQVHNTSR